MSQFCKMMEFVMLAFLALQEGIPLYSKVDGSVHVPNFNLPAQNITAVAGKTAILPCTIDYIGEHKVAWMDPTLKLLTVDDKRIIDETRISVERPYTKEWNLHIRHVRMNDSGEYRCQINTNPVKSMKVVLVVLEPPRIVESSRNVTVREGELVTLFCRVQGEPYPTVKWYRKHVYDRQTPQEIVSTEDGETLLIHNISRYCEDEYECVADNNVEPLANHKVMVSVQFPPEVELMNTRLIQSKGKETILLCKITSNPLGVMMWQYKGRDLINSGKYGVELYDDNRNAKTLAVRIGHIDDDDFGEYTCYARNEHGSDEQSMILSELVEIRQPVRTTTTNSPLYFEYGRGNSKGIYEHDGYHGNSEKKYVNSYTPNYIENNRHDFRKGEIGASRGGCSVVKQASSYVLLIFVTLCSLSAF